MIAIKLGKNEKKKEPRNDVTMKKGKFVFFLPEARFFLVFKRFCCFQFSEKKVNKQKMFFIKNCRVTFRVVWRTVISLCTFFSEGKEN
jgi:hypothetical protein